MGERLEGAASYTQEYFNFKLYINCPEYLFYFPQFNLGYRMNRLLVEIRRMQSDSGKIWK